MKPVRIAQVGTGHDHAAETMTCMRSLSCYDIVGVAEPNPEFADRLDTEECYQGLTRYTIEELLAMDDLEAVAIECEEERATYYAQLFADKGIHIHLDKPGTHGYEAFCKMVETMRQKDLVLQMGYMYRYNPMVQQALAIAKSGELGTIYSVEAHMSTTLKAPKQEWLGKYKGGMMYYLGCHDVDLILQCMGGVPDEIIPLNAHSGQNDVNSEDYGFAVLKYKNGVSFVKTSAAEYNGYNRRQLVICGTRGTLEVYPIEKRLGTPDRPDMMTAVGRVASMDRTKGATGLADRAQPLTCEAFGRYDGMMQSFAEYIRGESENPYTYDYECTLFKTIMQCCDAE